MGKYCVGDLPCTLEIEVADLIQQVEDYKAANLELRHKLAIAQAEVDGYVKRHDADRRHIVELGERIRRLAYGND
jgi:uncharacterized coiled-coil DUF342 family protein